MATLPSNLPDPPDQLNREAESARVEALPLPTPAPTPDGTWSSVKAWWRTDQTRWIHKEFLSTDLLCLATSACTSVYVKLAINRLRHPTSFDPQVNLAVLLLGSVLAVLFCQNYGLYRSRRTRTFTDETRVLGKSLFLSAVLLVGFVLLSGVEGVSWGTLFAATVADLGAMIGWRYHEFSRTERRIQAGVGTRNVLIVGAGHLGRQVAECLERNRHLGYVVKGFLDDSNNLGGGRVLGRVEDLSQVARAHFVDEVVIALPWESEIAGRATIEARRQRLNIKLVPNFYGGVGWHAPLEYLGEVPAFSLHREPIPAIALLLKRVIDILVSAIGLIALFPVLLVIGVFVRLDSTGPVLYRSYRVGKKGRRFLFYKFRTMVVNADALKEKLRVMNERKGPFFKMANDPRLTRIGKFLRRYSLDELPQLWNVLKGDMSLVGPRPHPLDDFQQYSLEHLRRLDVMPGMTGLWQVQARRDSSWETNMNLDLEYIEHWTPWMDIKIIAKTIPIVVKGLGQ